jgi:hypothetical protein
MSDRREGDIEDEVVKTALLQVAHVIERTETEVPIPQLATLKMKKAKRTRSMALVGSGLVLVLTAVGLIIGATVSTTPSHRTITGPPAHLHATPVLAVSPEINLDVMSSQLQVAVNLATGAIHTASADATAASPAANIRYGLQRSGYILGITSDGGETVSVSNDLQKVIHVWAGNGLFPAPASNPSDVWISKEFDSPPQAQEVNKVGRAVGLPVPIPRGSVVMGQVGSDLVVMTEADPLEILELWDPSTQQVLANFGPFDQMTTTPTGMAWTSGDVLRIYTRGRPGEVTVNGPVGDWATDLTGSPDGASLAVIWQPAPGSPGASSRAQIVGQSDLWVVNTNTGISTKVPGSSGSAGPIAWTGDGTRVFFGQNIGNAARMVISTYLLGGNDARKLKIPHVRLSNLYGPTNGSLIVWRSDGVPSG